MPNSNYLIEYPLLYAIWNGKYNEVVKLIINGYNVNEPAGGYIPLIIAMTKGDLQMIELLITIYSLI